MSQNPFPSPDSHREFPLPGHFVMRRWAHLARIIHNPWVTLAAALVCLAIFLGCMSIQVPERCVSCSKPEPDAPFHQEGQTTLAAGEERDIYYPIPYAHTPNLEISDPVNGTLVLEQKEDHFRICNQNWRPGLTLKWEARGIKAVPVVPVVPVGNPSLTAPLVMTPPVATSGTSPPPVPPQETPLPPIPIPIGRKDNTGT